MQIGPLKHLQSNCKAPSKQSKLTDAGKSQWKNLKNSTNLCAQVNTSVCFLHSVTLLLMNMETLTHIKILKTKTQLGTDIKKA